MAIDDMAKKAGDFLKDNTDKVQDALNSDKAEEISDKILDGAAGFANKVTGDKFADQVNSARDAADKKIGNE